MITREVREAIARAVAAEGFAPADPGLRPGQGPGCYASSVPLRLATGRAAREIAQLLAARLAELPWLAQSRPAGPGFIALTVTPQALAALPGRVAAAGPACASSTALSGVTLEAPPPADPRSAPGWEEARKELAAELTVRLAAAAGATVTAPRYPERSQPPPPGRTDTRLSGDVAAAMASGGMPEYGGDLSGGVAAAIAFAGEDTVRFWLARAMPGRFERAGAALMARHVPANPAYAVRYAHARAASGVRWAAILGAEAVPRRPPADPGELALLDALSWLPERVAVAARRGRPDEFARYLEELARVTIATLSSTSNPGSARAPGSDRLALARAARAGLAAGLGLLGVNAPDRL